MTPLRSFVAGAAALVLTPALAAAQVCVQPAEQTHFQVRALQSQLMVVAITCELQDDYNRFVTRFQPQLATAYRGVAGHFRRTSGGRAQRELDQYITNLANGQSQVGITRGTFFCREQAPLFQEALAAQPTAQSLAQITTARNVPMVYEPPVCSTPQRAQGTQRASSGQQQRPQGQQQQQRTQGQQRAQTAPASATR